MELLKKTAVEQRKALLNKEVSALELVEETFKQIENLDDKIGAYNSLTKEYAIETAKKLMKKLQKMKSCLLWQAFLLHSKTI